MSRKTRGAILSEAKVRAARSKDKQYKLYDERGLYLLVHPSGGKWWRFDYRFSGRRKTLSMGTYPDVSLKEARIRRDEARIQLAKGIDPGEARKAAKGVGQDTFEAVAREWLQKMRAGWVESHYTNVVRRLEINVFPWLGRRPIGEITAPELLACLRRIEARGAVETAHRAKSTVGQVLRYAIATGRAERDISADLRGALEAKAKRHHASITEPAEIGALLRAIDDYQGDHVTRCALKLAPLTFVRPGELRRAEWTEIDMEGAEWRIPAAKMKMNEPHIVPLSRQALAVLEDLRPLTGRGRYLFPGARSAERPMSENTINGALRRLGYSKEQMTGHGFRSMASTRLNESQLWHKDAIERQLAHGERDNIRAAYNYAEHLEERRKMMQWWADYLDDLREGRNGEKGG